MALNEKKKKDWENTLRELKLMDEGDEIVEHSAADYWKKELIGKTQVRGNMFFTKERFVFCSGFGITNLSFSYSEMKGLRLCNIGIMPTGIEITVFNNEKGKDQKYLISVMKRKQWLALLQEKTKLG